MPLPSGSKIELAMTCAASATLPRTDRLNKFASDGTEKHNFLADCAVMTREEALERVAPELRDFCEGLPLDILPVGLGFRAETALAYDVVDEKVRFLGQNIGRDYGVKASHEICLSIDVEGLRDGIAYVADWKTGRGPVTAAKDNWQLRLAALAVARRHNLSRARAAIIRLKEDGTPYFDVAEFDDFDLASFAAQLRELYARLCEPERVRPVAGEHCKYCPAFEACPAQGQLIAKMAMSPNDIGHEIAGMLTVENAPKAYERLKMVDAVMKKMWAALYSYAGSAPIQLGDGKVFGPHQTESTVLDANVVRTVLTELHGSAVAEQACDFETSHAAMKRALRTAQEQRRHAGEKVTLKELDEAAMKAITARGGVSTKVGEKFGVYTSEEVE